MTQSRIILPRLRISAVATLLAFASGLPTVNAQTPPERPGPNPSGPNPLGPNQSGPVPVEPKAKEPGKKSDRAPQSKPPADGKAEFKTDPKTDPQLADPKVGDPKAQPKAPNALAQPKSDGARPVDKLPQTAEEKAKSLGDLYAQLATAEDEAAAKKISDQVERLWRHSGSDTVNLLMSRSSKAINEKKFELAEKLLEHITTLAPEYAEGFNQRAYMRFMQNSFEGAVGDLRRVLALEPNHYKALEGLAQIWREIGNKKGAFEVMKQLMDVHPFAPGAKQSYDDLKRDVDGQGI